MPEISFDNIKSIVGSYEDIRKPLEILPKNTFYWSNPEGNDTGFATFAQVVDEKTIIYNLIGGYIPKASLGVKVPGEAVGVDSNLERTIFAYKGNTYEVKHKSVSCLDPVLGLKEYYPEEKSIKTE